MKMHDYSGSQKGGGKDGRHRRTAAQRRTQQEMTQCAQAWNEQLTEEQRIAWRRLAAALPRRVRNGRFYRLRGHQVFRAINTVLGLLGRRLRTDPPPEPKFGVNPKVALKIKGTRHGLSLKLGVSGTPTEDIMVFASPPWKAGRTYCGDYRFLGLGLAGTLALPVRPLFAPRSKPRGFPQLVPGHLETRDRYFPWPTAHSQPPAAARYSVPLAATGEAQILDPRLMRSSTSSVWPAFNTHDAATLRIATALTS
jgi:hypothetical protein